jgi:transposase InsO family protein
MFMFRDLYARFTRWIEIPDGKASTVAEALVNELVCRHGFPSMLLTDRGTNFTSALFRGVSKLLGINKVFTTAEHPQTDAAAERLNRFCIVRIRSQGIRCSPQFRSLIA